MSRRVLVGFIVVNVIVSLVVAMVIVRVDRSRRPNEPQEGPTQIVILTATPLPGFMLEPAEYQSTIDYCCSLGPRFISGPRWSPL